MDSRSNPKMSKPPEPDDGPPPLPSHLPEIEFEDEPPGAYLRELRAGRWTVVWSVVNVSLLAAVAVAWFSGAVEPAAAARAPAELLWALLPASSTIALIVSGWFLLVEVSSPVSVNAKWSVVLAILSLLVWLVLRYGFGILFTEV
jgi:hypothetical protein